MAEHNLLGKAGEDAAVDYLERHDYVIRHRNWRKGHFELDIVAAKDNELIVIEVKTRSNTLFAEPEDAVDLPKIRRTVRAADTYIRLFQIDSPQDAVTPQKIRRTVIAADTYIKLFQIDEPVRFDIITVIGKTGNFRIEHIKEAFYPPLF